MGVCYDCDLVDSPVDLAALASWLRTPVAGDTATLTLLVASDSSDTVSLVTRINGGTRIRCALVDASSGAFLQPINPFANAVTKAAGAVELDGVAAVPGISCASSGVATAVAAGTGAALIEDATYSGFVAKTFPQYPSVPGAAFESSSMVLSAVGYDILNRFLPRSQRAQLVNWAALSGHTLTFALTAGNAGDVPAALKRLSGGADLNCALVDPLTLNPLAAGTMTWSASGDGITMPPLGAAGLEVVAMQAGVVGVSCKPGSGLPATATFATFAAGRLIPVVVEVVLPAGGVLRIVPAPLLGVEDADLSTVLREDAPNCADGFDASGLPSPPPLSALNVRQARAVAALANSPGKAVSVIVSDAATSGSISRILSRLGFSGVTCAQETDPATGDAVITCSGGASSSCTGTATAVGVVPSATGGKVRLIPQASIRKPTPAAGRIVSGPYIIANGTEQRISPKDGFHEVVLTLPQLASPSAATRDAYALMCVGSMATAAVLWPAEAPQVVAHYVMFRAPATKLWEETECAALKVSKLNLTPSMLSKSSAKVLMRFQPSSKCKTLADMCGTYTAEASSCVFAFTDSRYNVCPPKEFGYSAGA
ncbi:hypothetical protein HXX76_008993 [Chlamydomonas incerta]|uniref:Pherophorin domain-containing protein n=1 Tax=Chlamydomonas incerta TaxID=51695 RepID=A0A835ST49_CHLIN|nr:hypothetical protein HXX76_008993 [Chlamydomonas incerta]|eukprot:KAG2432653.1 hypothetical protein HXX76_008993 [Chlamydomonas incerta]